VWPICNMMKWFMKTVVISVFQCADCGSVSGGRVNFGQVLLAVVR
jgi:hypothetical protein